jgi:phosphatidylglycerol lysyltransferase
MEREILEHAVRRWGRTAFSFDVLEAPERYEYFASERVPGAVVAFRRVGSVDAVMGEPLAPLESMGEVTHEFLASRGALGRKVVGFCASEEFARAAAQMGAAAAQITAEPELDPVSYEPVGGSAKKLRAYARRLLRAGVRGVALPAGTRRFDPEFRRAAEGIVAAWKDRARHTSAHILEIDLWVRAEEKRYFAVFDPKSSDRLWSLLVAHPVHGNEGFHLCHLMRHPDAPKGTNELVVLTAIETLGDEGVRYATFGPYAVPFAGEFIGFGPVAERIVRWLYQIAARWIGYGSSVEFYRKIQAGPWRPRFLVIWPRRSLIRGFYTMTRLAHVFGFLEGKQSGATPDAQSQPGGDA